MGWALSLHLKGIQTIRISSQILGFCLLWFSFGSAALPVEDLYVAEVLVTDESARQLNEGARAGLLQVLIRVSGTPGVEESSLVAGSLRNPQAYYNQYTYESTDRVLQLDGAAVPVRILRIHFDPNAVARLLRGAGFPVWGSNRPGVLLWIAVSDERGRRILGEHDGGPLVAALQDEARLRGIPLLFPLLDLEDAALSTAEVWGSFLERIDTASARYSPDGVLTGRFQRDALGQWTANWAYRIESRWQDVTASAVDVRELAHTVIDRLANELALLYGLDSSREVVVIRVESVDSASDYASLGTYLGSLTPVLDTLVVGVRGDEVELHLDIEGQRDQLIEIIELDDSLALMSRSQAALVYRWLR
jgi:hypothetical protein